MTSSIKIDPRTKIVLAIVFSTLSIIYNDLFFLFTLLLISILISFFMKADLIGIVFRLRKGISVMVAIAIVQSIFTKTGSPILEIGNLTIIRDYGLIRALEYMLRIGNMIVSASILSTSTSREIIQGLVEWKCPYEIAFMVSVAIRFLPILKDEMTDMIIAIQLRGVDLERIKLKEKIKIYKYILLPIVINSLLKAKELSSAMEMRAFRAYPIRTSYMRLKMQKKDYIISIGSLAIFIIILL